MGSYFLGFVNIHILLFMSELCVPLISGQYYLYSSCPGSAVNLVPESIRGRAMLSLPPAMLELTITVNMQYDKRGNIKVLRLIPVMVDETKCVKYSSSNVHVCYNYSEFHWGRSKEEGSDHSIKGRSYPIEIQHYFSRTNTSHSLTPLVVAVLFEETVGDYEDGQEKYKRLMEEGVNMSLPLGRYLPEDLMNEPFYQYRDPVSETCSKGREWIVFETTLRVNPSFLGFLRSLSGDEDENHYQIYSGDRCILHSFHSGSGDDVCGILESVAERMATHAEFPDEHISDLDAQVFENIEKSNIEKSVDQTVIESTDLPSDLTSSTTVKVDINSESVSVNLVGLPVAEEVTVKPKEFAHSGNWLSNSLNSNMVKSIYTFEGLTSDEFNLIETDAKYTASSESVERTRVKTTIDVDFVAANYNHSSSNMPIHIFQSVSMTLDSQKVTKSTFDFLTGSMELTTKEKMISVDFSQSSVKLPVLYHTRTVHNSALDSTKQKLFEISSSKLLDTMVITRPAFEVSSFKGIVETLVKGSEESYHRERVVLSSNRNTVMFTEDMFKGTPLSSIPPVLNEEVTHVITSSALTTMDTLLTLKSSTMNANPLTLFGTSMSFKSKLDNTLIAVSTAINFKSKSDESLIAESTSILKVLDPGALPFEDNEPELVTAPLANEVKDEDADSSCNVSGTIYMLVFLNFLIQIYWKELI